MSRKEKAERQRQQQIVEETAKLKKARQARIKEELNLFTEKLEENTRKLLWSNAMEQANSNFILRDKSQQEKLSHAEHIFKEMVSTKFLVENSYSPSDVMED